MLRKSFTAMMIVFALAAPAAAGGGYAQDPAGKTDRAKPAQKEKAKEEKHGGHADKAMTHGRETARARAEIRGDRITGEAEFVEMETPDGQKLLHVNVSVKGDPAVLTPGLHGVHLHQTGVCEAPYTSAGGHFDPGPAGNNDPDANHPYHMGDLPNIRIGADGSGTLRAVTTRATISDGPLTLFDADGASIMIHGNEDQMVTGAPKSGVSGGPRVACGVVRKM